MARKRMPIPVPTIAQMTTPTEPERIGTVAAAPIFGPDPDQQQLRFVGGDPCHRETDGLAADRRDQGAGARHREHVLEGLPGPVLIPGRREARFM